MAVQIPAVNNSEAGSSLVESLVTISLVAIASLPIAYSMNASVRDYKRNLREEVAAELANDKMEQLAAINPETLDSGDESSESNLKVSDIAFTRTVDIAVNSDGSRSVTVAVAPKNNVMGGRVTISNTFSLWGAD